MLFPFGKKKKGGEAPEPEVKGTIKIIQMVESDSPLWSRGAALVYIRGTGALKKEAVGTAGKGYGGNLVYDLTIQGKPISQALGKEEQKSGCLARVMEPYCPTCAGILAAGYGREHTDLEEFLKTEQKLNEDFISLEDSIEKAAPLLGLLESGIYVIADLLACPTDGDGSFFWDFPEETEENPAAAECIYTPNVHFGSGLPVFLFPTQGAHRFSRERVEYYRQKYRTEDKSHFPRAISYRLYGHVSALLDGHHKACAAALEGERVPCLTIMPFTGYTLKADQKRKEWLKDKANFCGISIKLEHLEEWVKDELERQQKSRETGARGGEKDKKRNGEAEISLENGPLSRRQWEKNYRMSCFLYPDAEEYGEILYNNLDGDNITDQQIKESLDDIYREGGAKLLAILAILGMKKDSRLKETAMECIQRSRDYSLKKRAFQSLLQIKGDKDVEEFMIQYLVEEPVAGDTLRDLAYGYFEE